MTIDRRTADAHVMRPINTVGVQGLTEQSPMISSVARAPRRKSPTHRFDYQAFADGMALALPANVSGFYWEIQHNGVQVITGSAKYARTQADGAALWNAQIPMHIARCSKLVTAMAMTKVMAEHHISLEQTIAPYCPPTGRRAAM